MSWNDDSWRDSYDAWKLASPYDDYAEPEECPHDEYEIDICTGRAECGRCDHTWYASQEEIDDEIRRIADYQAWVEKEYRRERWQRMTRWFRWPLFRLLERLWPSKATKVHDDDEIPF